jgi:hypothetical protein
MYSKVPDKTDMHLTSYIFPKGKDLAFGWTLG